MLKATIMTSCVDKIDLLGLGIMAHAFNPSIWEAEKDDSLGVQGQLLLPSYFQSRQDYITVTFIKENKHISIWLMPIMEVTNNSAPDSYLELQTWPRTNGCAAFIDSTTIILLKR